MDADNAKSNRMLVREVVLYGWMYRIYNSCRQNFGMLAVEFMNLELL